MEEIEPPPNWDKFTPLNTVLQYLEKNLKESSYYQEVIIEIKQTITSLRQREMPPEKYDQILTREKPFYSNGNHALYLKPKTKQGECPYKKRRFIIKEPPKSPIKELLDESHLEQIAQSA